MWKNIIVVLEVGIFFLSPFFFFASDKETFGVREALENLFCFLRWMSMLLVIFVLVVIIFLKTSLTLVDSLFFAILSLSIVFPLLTLYFAVRKNRTGLFSSTDKAMFSSFDGNLRIVVAMLVVANLLIPKIVIQESSFSFGLNLISNNFPVFLAFSTIFGVFSKHFKCLIGKDNSYQYLISVIVFILISSSRQEFNSNTDLNHEFKFILYLFALLPSIVLIYYSIILCDSQLKINAQGIYGQFFYLKWKSIRSWKWTDGHDNRIYIYHNAFWPISKHIELTTYPFDKSKLEQVFMQYAAEKLLIKPNPQSFNVG
jgi:hypothetical protein